MRIDIFLAQHGLAKSRTEAKQLIEAGAVMYRRAQVKAASYQLPDDTSPDDIEIVRERMSYVSRGGLKLQAALETFDALPDGQICLDVGASSGGFTHCLLSHGAKKVYAVDVGEGQLHPQLLQDKRVVLYEHFNARYMQKDSFPDTPTFATMDVSFISQTLILPALYKVLGNDAHAITLVKPQFELTRSALNRHGIVKDKSMLNVALDRVVSFAKTLGFSVLGSIQSPIQGGDGNIEFLIHLKKENYHE